MIKVYHSIRLILMFDAYYSIGPTPALLFKCFSQWLFVRNIWSWQVNSPKFKIATFLTSIAEGAKVSWIFHEQVHRQLFQRVLYMYLLCAYFTDSRAACINNAWTVLQFSPLDTKETCIMHWSAHTLTRKLSINSMTIQSWREKYGIYLSLDGFSNQIWSGVISVSDSHLSPIHCSIMQLTSQQRYQLTPFWNLC
jgi:multisubunit Na+/H+ antiporter MnhE subunit